VNTFAEAITFPELDRISDASEEEEETDVTIMQTHRRKR
jgi:hypothetical protein